MEETKRALQRDYEIDEKFLESSVDAEANPALKEAGSAHAPHWPGVGFTIINCCFRSSSYNIRFVNPLGGSSWQTTSPTALLCHL